MQKFLDLDYNNVIGTGVHGKVYPLLSSKDKCVKISTLYRTSYKSSIIKNNLDYVILYKPKHFVRTYSVSIIEENSDFIIFSYVMDKLLPINFVEELVFHTLVSHEDINKKKDLSHDHIVKTVNGLSLGLDFDTERVIMFCDLLRESRIKHLDVHQRNIRKDKLGNYKLVDLDNLLIGD